ncbi:MAG: hypothetical protein FWG61_00990 [Firmicutes bacterium]|nr:hypothetical protein [Bacillota bacterium]
MNVAARIIRMLTIPPVLAIGLVSLVFWVDQASVGGFLQYGAMILFLAVFPALAYPLQPFLPGFKNRGREGQRELAFFTSVAGYSCGVTFAALTAAPILVHIICWSYLLSVGLLTLVNKLTPIKASGHACGVAGPLCALIFYFGLKALPVAIVFALMTWSSLQLKRHGFLEIIFGGTTSVTAFFLALLLISKVV